MTTLRSKAIRLAYINPALRPHLLPLLKEAAKDKWPQAMAEAKADKQRGVMTTGEYNDLIKAIQNADSADDASDLVSKARKSRTASLPREIYLPRNNPTLSKRQNTPPGLDIWTWEEEAPLGTVYRGVAFAGKSLKHLWNYRFKDVFQQEKQIKETIDNYNAVLAEKAKRQQTRALYSQTYKVGDVLSGSWGYDQTQNSYYEVVDVPTPKSVVLREIDQKVVRREHGANYVVPVPGAFKGPLMKKIPGPGGRVRIESFLSVSKWDGKPDYETPFEMGH
jgi:hypothetical protein